MQIDGPESTAAQPSSPANIIDEVLKDIQIEELPADSLREIDQTAEAISAPAEDTDPHAKTADIPANEEPQNLSNDEFNSPDLS